MRKKIIILGTGGTSGDILDTIVDLQALGANLECIGFLDDNENNWGKKIRDIKILGPLVKATSFPSAYFINGIGSPSNFVFKEKIIREIHVPTTRFLSLIHPTASVSKTAKIGKGTVIFQNVTVTTNVKIGNHVVVLPNSILSHDSQVDDYCCIAGGVCISGGVKVGKSCYLGTNSTFRQGVTIGNMSLVGMGSVVIKDVPSKSVVVGNPARLLRKLNNEKN